MHKKTEEDPLQKAILLAEDDALSSSYFQSVLSGEKYIVITVENGDDAVDVVRYNPNIAIVLMDIKMPIKSGIEAAREIRSFNKEIPLIAQTAFALAGDRETILEAGFNEYISKPISRKDLIATIQKYI